MTEAKKTENAKVADKAEDLTDVVAEEVGADENKMSLGKKMMIGGAVLAAAAAVGFIAFGRNGDTAETAADLIK